MAWLQEQTPEDMHVKEIGLHVENIITIIDSIINIVGRDLYDHFIITKIFIFYNKQDIPLNSKNCEESDYGLDSEFALHLVLIVCSIS